MTSKEDECTGDFGCPHCNMCKCGHPLDEHSTAMHCTRPWCPCLGFRAASKLPSAPSPAGETASEHVVEVYGTFAGPNQPAVFFEGKCSCGATWRTITEVWICPKSLPEPVPTEGAAEYAWCSNCRADRSFYVQEGKRRERHCNTCENYLGVAAPIAPAAVSETLDVERAQMWLADNFPYVLSRQMAELLHDYSLTVRKPSAEGHRVSVYQDAHITDERSRMGRLGLRPAKPSAEGDGWNYDVSGHTSESCGYGGQVQIAFLMGGEAFVTVGRFDCGHWEHAHGRFRDDQTVYAWTKLRKAPPLPAPPSGQGEVK